MCMTVFYTRTCLQSKEQSHKWDGFPWTQVSSRWNFPKCLWECTLVQPLRKTVWRFLRKLKTEVPHDPAIPLLGISLGKKMKTLIRKDACTPKFTAALLTIDKIWKEPVSTKRWMDKEDMIFTHMHIHIYKVEYHSAIKRMKILPSAEHERTWRALC